MLADPSPVLRTKSQLRYHWQKGTYTRPDARPKGNSGLKDGMFAKIKLSPTNEEITRVIILE